MSTLSDDLGARRPAAPDDLIAERKRQWSADLHRANMEMLYAPARRPSLTERLGSVLLGVFLCSVVAIFFCVAVQAVRQTFFK